MKLNDVARIGYEVVRAMDAAIGTNSPAWIDATVEDRESHYMRAAEIKAGITPEEIHNRVVTERIAAGWKKGKSFDEEKKTDPTLVPYEKLPESVRASDAAFAAVVSMLLPYMNPARDCYVDSGDGSFLVGLIPD